LQTIPITRPFCTWGLDLVGQFKKAKVGFIHIFIAVDKFTKWVEVKPTASITVTKTMEFIKEIMYKIGVPNNIITNNETQFIAKEFKEFVQTRELKSIILSVTPVEQWPSGVLKWHGPSGTKAQNL
jgi:hypothetical protein